MARVRDLSGNGGRINVGAADPMQANEGVDGVPTGKRADNLPLRPTYGTGIVGVAPAAALTDAFDISNPVGSGKIIRIMSIILGGTITTAENRAVTFARRSTLNSGGTATVLVPVAHDTRDAALSPSVAVIKAYTANPSLGTLVGTLHAFRLNLSPAANGGVDRIQAQYSWINDKAVVLLPGECLGVNFNGATLGAGAALDIDYEFSEENL